MTMIGKAHKFGDDINTDYIIAGKHRAKGLDLQAMARHLMEDLDPEFYKKVSPGDFIVAGHNFGCGSSREYAARVILAAGVRAVIAKSFARIFYRNAINNGLPVIEGDTDEIQGGHELEVDLGRGTIHNRNTGRIICFNPIPSAMMEILKDGGLVEHFKKHGGFHLV